MRGLLVRDRKFWIIKHGYPKHSELPSKHLGSPSSNCKTLAINLRSLNPFHKDEYGDVCQVQRKILWVYVCTRTLFFWEEEWQLLLDWAYA